MDFLELAKSRYSCRAFTDRPIEDEKLAKLIEAARIAPTGKNNQPQRIYILKSEDAIEKINSICKCIFGAKTVFMIAVDTDREWKSTYEEGFTSGIEDISIVATHIMLEAKELGLETCWVNAFPQSKAEALFAIPENEKVILLMPVGYPDEAKAAPSPRHEESRDDTEMIQLK
ncbi:MAG: nitroreductase family protein [Saccharofermentans sp.]|nr:nitroreductase family protein [Saccharofermentans sp.]